MDVRTSGAWLIHHTNKLGKVNSNDFFWDVEQAGKCGQLLSVISEDSESTLSKARVLTLANFMGIKRTELKGLLDILEKERLVNIDSQGGVSVLGVTQTGVLTNTNLIFQNSEDNGGYGKASIFIAEKVSESPTDETQLMEEVSDEYKIASNEVDNLFEYVKNCRLVDFEKYGDRNMLFNGNLFNRENAGKSDKILSTLSEGEQRKVLELDEVIVSEGCVGYSRALTILGQILYEKLASISFYSINTVSNENGKTMYITKPSAFKKFGDSFVADTFDYAKALVCSLKYGMEKSPDKRGNIKDYEALIRKLIRREPIGPAPAIGKDYRYLQLKNVVTIELQEGSKTHYYMTLLKKEVGEMALEVLKHGQSMEQAVLGASERTATSYESPESNRVLNRNSVQEKFNAGRTEFDIRTMIDSLTD